MSPTATMTSSAYLGAHPPPVAPPTIPLPPLPMSKTRKSSRLESPERISVPVRKSSSGLPSPVVRRSATTSPATASRSVTASAIPTPKPVKLASSPAIPTLKTIQPLSPPTLSATPTNALRKTVSIESFPQPPKRSSRLSSLPPSPLSTSVSLEADSPDSQQIRPSLSPPKSRVRRPSLKPSTSQFGLRQKSSASSLKALSLLNNANPGDTRSVPHSPLTLPSLPWSRRSSSRDSLNSLSNEGSAMGDGDEESIASSPNSNTHNSQRDSVATLKDGKGNVLVSVRVRPDAGGTDGAKVEGEWMVDGRRSLVSFKGKEGGEYVYDNVFSAHDNNSRVYDSAAKRLVRRVMEGYNGTVFAYGMTGTGKTFSMQGTAASPGVIPLAITDIFSYIRENPNREFLLRVSYLEIYNEKIFDLLGLSSGQQQEEIKLREDSKRGVYATPLKEEIVQSPNQLLRVIARGDQARRVAGTQFNARSSRSHAVVQIVVESRERTAPSDNRRQDAVTAGGVLVSTLSLIDLAGSEKAAENKERRTEGAHINKSLLTLGTVIGKLSGDKDGKEGPDKDQKHLPYRDSKLTRLLQPALSGGSLVSILCTIQLSSAGTSAAAASTHTNETLNTLKFASRAKNNIVSHAKKNVSDAGGVDAGSRALLDRYRLEILDLRQQLEDQQNKVKEEPDLEPEPDSGRARLEEEEELWLQRRRENEQRHEEQMLEMQLARTALKERISHLNRLILSSKSIGVNSARFSTSSTATPCSNRLSTSSAVELANSRRQSALSSPNQSRPSSMRALSAGSATFGVMPTASTSQIEFASASDDDEVETDTTGSFSGKASRERQIRTLRADLADKNRYIMTLEKRLLQTQSRHSSQGKSNIAPSQHDSALARGDTDALIREKDRQLEEMRARLDDQIKMVSALRSAARKREMLDSGHHPAYRRQSSFSPAANRTMSAAPSAQQYTQRQQQQQQQNQNENRNPPMRPESSRQSTGSSVQNFSRLTIQTAIAAAERALREEQEQDELDEQEKQLPAELRDTSKSNRKSSRRSVDEMTKLLDEMIQGKGESGEMMFRGYRGEPLNLKRDTVMDRVELQQEGLGYGIGSGAGIVGGIERDERRDSTGGAVELPA